MGMVPIEPIDEVCMLRLSWLGLKTVCWLFLIDCVRLMRGLNAGLLWEDEDDLAGKALKFGLSGNPDPSS